MATPLHPHNAHAPTHTRTRTHALTRTPCDSSRPSVRSWARTRRARRRTTWRSCRTRSGCVCMSVCVCVVLCSMGSLSRPCHPSRIPTHNHQPFTLPPFIPPLPFSYHPSHPPPHHQKAELPDEARAAAEKELRRLKRMQASQPEYTVRRPPHIHIHVYIHIYICISFYAPANVHVLVYARQTASCAHVRAYPRVCLRAFSPRRAAPLRLPSYPRTTPWTPPSPRVLIGPLVD
jgi:hypothetical protein